FFSSRRRHTRFDCDWSSDVCSSDLGEVAPHDLNAPGGGYGFGFQDPERRNFAVVCGGETHAATPAPDRPHKITHINLNAREYDATTRFMCDVLGFRLIDETVRARFLHAAR